MNELQRLSRNLISMIIDYSNSNERELIDDTFDPAAYIRLQAIVNKLANMNSIRSKLFPYFLHVLFKIQVFNHPELGGNREELKAILMQFFKALIALVDMPQNNSHSITYTDQTINIPGFKNGIVTNASLTCLGQIVNIFLKNYRITKLEEEVNSIIQSSLAAEENRNLREIHQILSNENKKICAQIKALEENIESLVAQNKSSSQHLAEANTTITSLKRKIQEDKTRMQVLSRTIEDRTGIQKELKLQIEQLENTSRADKAKISQLEEITNELEATNVLLTNTIEEYQTQNTELKKTLQEKEQVISGARSTIGVLRKTLVEKQTPIAAQEPKKTSSILARFFFADEDENGAPREFRPS